MSKDAEIFKVLVSSPSDVKEERELLESIVGEINKTISSRSKIRLDLVKRETDVSPGVGEYPQEVINRKIGDIDIFIGILWTRFGTPTNNALSGTEEEFNLAYQKHTTSQGSIRIMFYFKTTPVNPHEVDTKQIELIKEFRDNLGGKNILWDEFKDINDFEKKVRMHLNQEINDIETKANEEKSDALINTKVEDSKDSLTCCKWKLLFEHDADGKTIIGDYNKLFEAVINGSPIRIRVHHPNNVIHVMDAPLLSVDNGVIHASDIAQISQTKDEAGNYIYQDKSYHYYVVISSNGHFHAKRIFFDGKERNTTNSKRRVAWFGFVS